MTIGCNYHQLFYDARKALLNFRLDKESYCPSSTVVRYPPPPPTPLNKEFSRLLARLRCSQYFSFLLSQVVRVGLQNRNWVSLCYALYKTALSFLTKPKCAKLSPHEPQVTVSKETTWRKLRRPVKVC